MLSDKEKKVLNFIEISNIESLLECIDVVTCNHDYIDFLLEFVNIDIELNFGSLALSRRVLLDRIETIKKGM